MSTIFKCEEIIKKYIPSITNIIIYPTSEKFLMNVYYKNKSGKFDETLIPKIKDLLPCHLEYNFKPFKEASVDNVPVKLILPESIKQLALETDGTLKSFTNVVQKALHELCPIEITLSQDECVINIETNSKLSDSDINKYSAYALAVAPIGCKINLICK